MADDEDPYAVSSDSEDEGPRKPPPKIQIEGRQGDLAALKSALLEKKEPVAKDEAVEEDLKKLKEKSGELAKFKKDLESGPSSKVELSEDKKKELEEVAAASKEKLTGFKDKLEKGGDSAESLEERLKSLQSELVGVGKENLSSFKEKFEKGIGDSEVERTAPVEIERSAEEKKRILAAFIKDSATVDDVPKDCGLCGKIVYQAERIFARKTIYHNTCFKCCKCAKKLTPTNYNYEQNQLLCKVHFLELKHPELARNMDPHTTEEDEHGGDEDDEEFAVSSRPKHLSADVVRAGAQVADELAQIRSLKEKKTLLESSIADATKVAEKIRIEEEITSGHAKALKDKLLSGAAEPDVKGQREELHFDQVGDLKNKWKTGAVETAETREAETKEELEALRGGAKLKDRFQEKSEADKVVERQWDRSQLDTSFAAEARKSFLEGAAFQTGPIEKTTADLEAMEFAKLTSFKERFEKGAGDAEVVKTQVDIDIGNLGERKANLTKGEDEMTPEERAAQKKKEIEAEFLRYKLARRAAAERAKTEAEEGGAAGTAEAPEKAGQDVEYKMAGKAREKFKQIDASGATPVLPGQNKKSEPSKWDKKETSTAEVINRREQKESSEEPEDEDAFDVKNLMNKFKKIETAGGESKISSEQRAELEALKTEARNLKDRFEHAGGEEAEELKEKQKRLEEEFVRLREEREKAQAALKAEEDAEDRAENTKEDIQIAADHASKMTAKWEKIQKKEAKKAEKSKMPAKAGTDN